MISFWMDIPEKRTDVFVPVPEYGNNPCAEL